MEKNSHRILLIEDEEVIAHYIREAFAYIDEVRYELIWADDLGAGIAILARETIDLVLLDLNLPDSRGLTTLRTLLAAAPEIAVVLLTGINDDRMETEAIQIGAQDYLVKGLIDARQIRRSIRYAMERRSILTKIERQNRELLAAHADLEKAYNDRQEAQVRILQQEKMAAIGQLAAGIAHEINNPVGFIMSNLNTLSRYVERLRAFIELQNQAIGTLAAEEIVSEVRAKQLEMKIDFVIEDAGNLIAESLEGTARIQGIVRDFKNFSRRDQAERKSVNLNDLLDSTINIVWNELKYKATLVKNYGELPPVLCYHQQMSQVFMNLLMNAAQAIEQQGSIEIRTWSEADNACIAIRDSGCGIPRENLDRIFEPFFTTKDVGKGTGLGLSIVYEVVKKHGGDIRVESIMGQGTEFTLRIPAEGGGDDESGNDTLCR